VVVVKEQKLLGCRVGCRLVVLAVVVVVVVDAAAGHSS